MGYQENWPGLKPKVAADLDHIASLGGGVIRLTFVADQCGFPEPQVTQYLLELLQLASERKIKAIITFGNTSLVCGPYPSPTPPDWDNCSPQDGHTRWWMLSYSNFADFLGVSQYWIDRVVSAVRDSGYSSTVLFYDYQNEYNKLGLPIF